MSVPGSRQLQPSLGPTGGGQCQNETSPLLSEQNQADPGCLLLWERVCAGLSWAGWWDPAAELSPSQDGGVRQRVNPHVAVTDTPSGPFLLPFQGLKEKVKHSSLTPEL